MSGALLEQLMLPARPGLRFLDAYSGRAIVDGLRCTLYHRRDRRDHEPAGPKEVATRHAPVCRYPGAPRRSRGAAKAGHAILFAASFTAALMR